MTYGRLGVTYARSPSSSPDTQIDHILPKSLTPSQLDDLKIFHNLASDFGVHEPENLALICTLCNGPWRKGDDSSLLKIPMTTMTLKRASKLSDRVKKGVADFDDSREINKAALRIAHADLKEPHTQKAFAQNAEAIVRTIAMFDPKKVDYTTSYGIQVSGHAGLAQATLTGDGRTAMLFLEKLTGGSFEDLVDEAIAALVKEARPRLSMDISNMRGVSPDASVGPIEWEWYLCDIDSLTFERVEDGFTFRFGGTFECTANTNIVYSKSSGDGLVSRNGNVLVQADPFYVEGSWYFDNLVQGPDNWEVNMDEWRPELWMDD